MIDLLCHTCIFFNNGCKGMESDGECVDFIPIDNLPL